MTNGPNGLTVLDESRSRSPSFHTISWDSRQNARDTGKGHDYHGQAEGHPLEGPTL
jgi:hypothetical protein